MEVNINVLASTGKKCSILDLARDFLDLLLNSKNFVEVPIEVVPPAMSEPEQEKEATPPVTDPVLFGLVY